MLACCLPLSLLPGTAQMILGNLQSYGSQLVFGSCMLSKLVVLKRSSNVCSHVLAKGWVVPDDFPAAVLSGGGRRL